MNDSLVEAVKDQHGTTPLYCLEQEGRRLLRPLDRGLVQEAAEDLLECRVRRRPLGTVAAVEIDRHGQLRVGLAALLQVEGESLEAGRLADAVLPQHDEIR